MNINIPFLYRDESLHLREGWVECNKNIDKRISNLNQEITQSNFTPEEIETIHKAAQEELNRLTDLHTQIQIRSDQLNKRKYCCGYISKSVRQLCALILLAKAFEAIGATLTYLDKYESRIPFSIFFVALVVDGIATMYEAKLTLDKEEENQLIKINNNGIRHAQIFNEFLDKLKAIHELDQNNSELRQIDRGIRALFKEYEKFPENYKSDEVLSYLAGFAIGKYPKAHPVRLRFDSIVEETSLRESLTSRQSISHLPKDQIKDLAYQNSWAFEGNSHPETRELSEKSNSNVKFLEQEPIIRNIEQRGDHLGNAKFSPNMDFSHSLKKSLSLDENDSPHYSLERQSERELNQHSDFLNQTRLSISPRIDEKEFFEDIENLLGVELPSITYLDDKRRKFTLSKKNQESSSSSSIAVDFNLRNRTISAHSEHQTPDLENQEHSPQIGLVLTEHDSGEEKNDLETCEEMNSAFATSNEFPIGEEAV